jgi:glutamine synthetase
MADAFYTVGPGVYEAALRYGEAVETADRAHLFKTLVKSVGLQHNVIPSFMAKPHQDLPGCSGHIHVSLSNLKNSTEKNLFMEGGDKSFNPEWNVKRGVDVPGISETCKSFLAGILKGLPSVHACFAPTINSYKRLVENFWAPITVSYGVENRTASIRLITPPTAEPLATRLEIRVPGADSNPYLAISAILASGLEGIRSKMVLDLLPAEQQSQEELKNSKRLARDLKEAYEEMGKEGSFARQVLGDGFVEHFVGTRKHEWKVWETAVTSWELKRYLEVV